MSIPPPSGPQQPEDPYRPPQPYPQNPQAQPPYPSYPQAPYQFWGQGYAPFTPPAPVNGVAIAALVLGLLCFLPAVGLVLGIIALVQIRKRGERGKGMAIAGAVVSSLGLALWAVSLSTNVASEVWAGAKEGASGNTSLSLAKGDCFDVPGKTFDEDVYDVDKVPCSGVHDGEVFGSISLSGDDYPGDDYVSDKAEGQCRPLQDTYAMDSWALTAEVDVYFLTPTEDSWTWGDREITCVFANTDESGTLTGSLRADASNLDADQLAFLDAVNTVDEILYEEPEEYADEDLSANQTWAGEVADVTDAQAKALSARTWPAEARGPVADLVKEMRDAGKEWASAATSPSADEFFDHYDKAYGYVDGDTTVTAREALGLATTPPSYDDESGGESGGSDGGNGSGGSSGGGLDV
ncbi:DUF4190 domain-containing protein [Streptomyces sp. NPDC002920]